VHGAVFEIVSVLNRERADGLRTVDARKLMSIPYGECGGNSTRAA
jgi:hypothetical protein